MWGRFRRFISGPVSRVFTETVCSVILFCFVLSLGFYGLLGPSARGWPPYRDGAERLFLDLDYAEYLYYRHLKKTSTVPEGNESFASFMHSFRTEAERKADPKGERWLMAHVLGEKASSDYLLSSVITPKVRESGEIPWANDKGFSDPRNRSCFFGKSSVSPDYAYIGFYIPGIKHSGARVYTSILASMRHRRYFAADAPGAYYKDGDRIMVYIKIPSSDIKGEGKKHGGH